MYKRLKITVPAAQVLAFACVLILTKVTTSERALLLYVLPTRQVVMNLNFPLVALSRVIVFIDGLSAYLHLSWEPEGALLAATITTAALVLFSCVALFWYLVIVEIEKRRHGESLIRFSNRSVELMKMAALLLLAMGSLFQLYSATMWSRDRQLSHDGFWPIEIILGGLLLLAWATIFIAMSIADFRRLVSSRRVSALPL